MISRIIAKLHVTRGLSVIAGVVAVGFLSGDSRAFYCNNNALEDPSNYYCGYQRGNYVLRANGVALIPSADDDDKAKLLVREPQDVGEVQERTLVSYGDTLDFGDWGQARVGGIGSNPHINEAGQVVFQATTDFGNGSSGNAEPGNPWFTHYDEIAALFVSDSGGEPQFVAGTGTELDGRVVCSEGIQPWPYMGEGGDYVFAASVKDARGGCDAIDQGDADNDYAWLGEASFVASLNPVARITRLVAGPTDDPDDVDSFREVTLYYDEVEGGGFDPAVTYRLLSNRGLFFSGDVFQSSSIDPILGLGAWTVTQDGTSGTYSGSSTGSDFGSYTCPPAGCDIDLIAQDRHAYLTSSGAPSTSTWPRISGVRFIGRGTVGSAGIEVPLKAVRVPSLADEATQLVVPAADTTKVAPGNPMAAGGEVTFSMRHASAIGHGGRLVADDGSFVVFAGLQERVEDSPWLADYFVTDNDIVNEYRTGVVHVDAGGQASLVAVTTPNFAQITGAQVADTGDVLYRATSQRSYEEDDTTEGEQACMSFTGVWAGADDSIAFPAGADSARNGAWAISGGIYFEFGDPLVEYENWSSSNSSGNQNYVSVANDSPTGNSEYSVEISAIQDDAGLYCDSLANVDAAVAAVDDGSARIRISRVQLTRAMKTDANPDIGSTEPLRFAPANVQVTKWEGTTTNIDPDGGSTERVQYATDGAIRKWSPSTKATTDIFRWNQASPGGFSVMRGASPHFSSGSGVVGFKAGLWTPHQGYWGGSGTNPFAIFDDTDPVNTILGHNNPCATQWDTEAYGPSYVTNFQYTWQGADTDCSGIFVWEGGEVKEIARTKKTAQVFSSQDDAGETGATEAGGLEFWTFGSSVAVSDTGTVFFTATDFGSKESQLGDDGATCDKEDLLDIRNDVFEVDGVFAYKNGEISRVMAELDVVTDTSGQELMIMSIALPQPELRQAVSGDDILVKFAADSDGDCVEDVVGSLVATVPQQGEGAGEEGNVEMYPDAGSFAAVNSSQGGRMRLAVADPSSGWVITNLEAIDSDNAEYLTDEEMNGSLLTFTAMLNPDGGTPTVELPDPVPPLELELEVEASVDRVIGLFKDIESKPDLLAGITESASGGSVITFSIEDNGPYDADDTPGVATDPSGLSLVPLVARLAPTIIPVPVMGQAVIAILGGLMSLLGGFFAWRRKET